MAEQNYTGGCHCGAVRYEVTTDPDTAIACNCSHCGKLGLTLTFVTPDKFKLQSGQEAQTEYRFNKHVIQHLFCPVCGTQSGSRSDGNATRFPSDRVNPLCLQ